MLGFANWPPIIRLAGCACNARGLGPQDRGFRPELRLSPLFYRDDQICERLFGHLAFQYPCRQFGKTCELSELSALSRRTEIVRGKRSKVPWPALGLPWGLHTSKTQIGGIFTANKIIGGLFCCVTDKVSNVD